MRSVLPTALAFAAGAAAASVCNGYSELCDRQYSNVTFIGSHDAPFVGDWLADNQYDTITQQLNLGVRFMTAQTHSEDGTIELCHTYCIEEDAGSLLGMLKTIKTWMDANPNEVFTLLVTNGDDIDISLYGTAFESAGLADYAYTPSGTLAIDSWPTLGELIDAGTRLVVFMDYNADTSEVAYILPEFTSYIFETPYDTTDSSFPECSIDRPSGASASGRMYLVNHYLDVDVLGVDIPDSAVASTTNGVKSIMAQANLCAGLYDRYPNFIILDYIDQGDFKDAQNEMNGL